MYVSTQRYFLILSITGTLKEIANEPLLKEQRRKQIEERRIQYLWKGYPDVGLPSSIDKSIISLPLDEEFHRAKLSISYQMYSKEWYLMRRLLTGPWELLMALFRKHLA